MFMTEVHLTDFRSFRGEHLWNLPTACGLYFITGENLLNPKLDRNGTGKSTLLDAIYWCLYGKTLRGLKAGDVIAWGEKSASVRLSLVINGLPYSVSRTQSPNSLTLNGKTVDQETVNQTLRIGPEAFCYSVMLPQFGESFFDLSPSAKLTLFSEIMGLEDWLLLSQKAEDEASAIQDAIGVIEQRQTRAEAGLEAINHDIVTLRARSGEFESKQAEATEASKAELKVLDVAMKAKEKELKGLAKRRLAISRDLKEVHDEVEKKARETTKAEKEFSALRDQDTRFETKLGDVKERLKALKGLPDKCPTCLQEVDKAHTKSELNALWAQHESFEFELKANKKVLTAADKAMMGLEEGLQGLNLRMVKLNKEDIALDRLKMSIEAEQASIEHRWSGLVNDQDEPNPYIDLLQEKVSARDVHQEVLDDLQYRYEQAKESYAATAYWVQGFKKLRLHIIEETLKTLEVEVNSNLTSLGMSDWRIEFDIERENKSGGVIKGFSVAIHSPDHTEPVKWEAWSGAETTLLALAGTLGLSNLIMTRAGLTSGVEFYDEPTNRLSQEPILSVAETLYARAHDQNKKIFMIDHNTIDFGSWDGIIKIVKDGEGSRLHE